ncbi:MAG TPA: response regulator [Vicinamibacterales bacterium]|jgi:DNA-binding response OmpR family regulator
MNRNALIVDPSPVHLGVSRRLLAESGFDVTVVSTFEDAKRRLSTGQPLALLITDVRLGPYNGFHLALRARATHPNICIIIADQSRDAALEREARGLGATYLVKPIAPEQLTRLVGEMFGPSGSATGTRRWARINLAQSIPVAIGEIPGRVLDMSYGGVRLQLPRTRMRDELPPILELVLPNNGVAVTIHPVWAKNSGEDADWQCGGELVDTDLRSVHEWRRFVDSYAASA